MHELTIASALVDQVCCEAERAGASRVVEINVRMGALSGISRALYFCFPSAARGTACEGAALSIEEVPLTVLCTRCDAVKTPAALYNFRCPDCGWPTPKVLTGREMQLVSVRVAPASGDRHVPSQPAHVSTPA
ncbi:MAG: hydrogenase maturation nickel metallochaperone HypA [Rhizobiales bacterium]|nr:hydrogenase maturation nickel metallochaperone HypA [Hyphomicrobiales bacterium]